MLEESQSVVAFLFGAGSLAPFVLIRLAMDFVRRGSGDLTVGD